MPDVQGAVVHGTLWESLATKSHLGLTHVPVRSEPIPESDGGMCPFVEQRPSAGQYPDPRQPNWCRPSGSTHRKDSTCGSVPPLRNLWEVSGQGYAAEGRPVGGRRQRSRLMLLAATQGTPLTLSATGPEAELAVRAVVDLV
jgi:hypothetical protein